MKKEEGITLISLVVTIIILLILAGTVTFSGIQSITTTKKTTFISELELIQAKVNTIYEKRKLSQQEKEYYDTLGQDITILPQDKLDEVLKGKKEDGFRYFSIDDLKELEIETTQEVMINFDSREVFSVTGIEIEGIRYYQLKDIPGYIGYNQEYVDKNTQAPTFEVQMSKLSSSWRVEIKNIQYPDNNDGGTISYKLHKSNNWILNNEKTYFEVNVPGLYDIKVTDKAGNSTILQKWIYVDNGLVAIYDGEYNTREGQDATSTIWEDLSKNKNDAIGYHMNTATGYYSEEEKGYVFLDNASYFKTTNNIGISGDDNYTIEVVMKPYNGTKYSNCCPIWFGVGASNYYVGGAVVTGYNYLSRNCFLDYINNSIVTKQININNNDNVSIVWSKVKKGQLVTGDTDYARMYVNGEKVDSTYTGTETFTAEIQNSQAEIGRFWQWNNENRTSNSVIKMIRVYNRTLTEEEIKSNYEIDSNRFFK